MKYYSLFVVLTLLITLNFQLSAQNLAVAGISGDAYKVQQTVGLLSGARANMGVATNGKEIPYFQEDLQKALELLVPAWLKDSGAKDLVVWDRKEAEEDDLSANDNLNKSVSLMATFEDSNKGIRIGGKKRSQEMVDDISVRLRDQTNTYADQLDRDYLFFIKVVATHNVPRNKMDKALKVGKKLNGPATIAVTIVDAADASVVASNLKTLNDPQPGDMSLKLNLSSKALVNKCESLVKKTYRQFLKKAGQ